MTLLDTSVWIDHLHRQDRVVTRLLQARRVRTHPMVIGELACGQIKDREYFLSRLEQLPTVPVIARHEDAMCLLEAKELVGRGLSWIDIHLLASCRLSQRGLLTRDKRLAAIAKELNVTASGR